MVVLLYPTLFKHVVDLLKGVMLNDERNVVFPMVG